MTGSVLGGRWSDYQLAKLKAENRGKGQPEVSLDYVVIFENILTSLHIDETEKYDTR